MPDYTKGTIYMLEPTIEYEEGDIYYGSTTQTLHKRFYEHKKLFRLNYQGKSKTLFEKYGIENVKIILIKNYPCEGKKELEAEEATYIRNNKCVHRNIPSRSQKEYREDNKEKLKAYFKDYNETNKEKKQEYFKGYCETNKEKLNEQRRQYREVNKEKINEKKKEKIKCECGCEVLKQNIRQHQSNKKHMDLMKCI